MKLAPLGLLCCAALAAQTASIEGVVANRTTGETLAGVHVRLVIGDIADMIVTGSGEPAVYGAISDHLGHFSITGMKPGIYVVMAERSGFEMAPPAKPGMPFVPLKAGQQLTAYKIEMLAQATISGRVVDEYGDPLQNVNVHLESPAGERNSDWLFGDTGDTTDDRGEFRLVTAPGRFYLRAQTPGNPMGQPEIRTDGSSAAPFIATYFPSAPTQDGGSLVQAAPGQNVTGLEIHMLRSATTPVARKLAISGVVTGVPDNALVSVSIRHPESVGQFIATTETMAGNDGKFAFHQLSSGTYRLSAQAVGAKTRWQSRPVDVTLSASDETNVQLALEAPEEINGTVEVRDAANAPAPLAGKFTIRLEPHGRMEQPQGSEEGETDAQGAFRIGNLFPGSFKLVIDPLPENGYLQSVTLDGQPAADQVLDLTRGVRGSRIIVTINRDGGQISGAVLGQDGKPLLNPMVMVCLVNDPKQLQDMDPEENSAKDGQYIIHAIRPGKYRLFALDTLSLAALASDSDSDDEIDKAFFNAAEEIEIKPGDRIVKDLKAFDKPIGKEP